MKNNGYMLILLILLFTTGFLVGLGTRHNQRIEFEENNIAATITNTTGDGKDCHKVYYANDLDCNESCTVPREVCK